MPAPGGFLAALGQAFQGYAADKDARLKETERQRSLGMQQGAATRAAELHGVQLENLRSEIAARNAKPVVPPHYDSDRAGFVTPGQPFSPVAGAPPKPPPPRDPATVVGGAEWERARRFDADLGEASHRRNRTYDAAHPIKDATALDANRAVRVGALFDGDPIIKNAKELAQGIAKVRSAAEDPTPAGDLSLLYGYNKLLDPGSVVRESEFATAAKSGSLPTQIAGAVLKVTQGVRLTPEQRADFVAQANKIARGQQKLVRETIRRHEERAKRLGLNPLDVVYDPFEGIMNDAPGSAPKAGRPVTTTPATDPILDKYGLTPKPRP